MTTIDQRDLSDLLKLAIPVTGRGSQFPILRCVRLIVGAGGATVIATDGDMSVIAHGPCKPDLDGLDVVVPAALLNTYLNGVRGDGTIESDGGELTLTFGGSNLRMRTLPPEDWPQVLIAEGTPIRIDAETKQRLAGILYAAARDDARPVLTCVGFGDGWAACTDSYRLAAVKVDGLPTALIPARAFETVFKHSEGDITLIVDERRATFIASNGTWTTRLVEGKYPDYHRLVADTTPHTLVANRQQFSDAVDRVSVFGRDAQTPIRLEMDGAHIRLSAKSLDVGEANETVDGQCDYKGQLGFTPAYLLDLLKSDVSDTVNIGIGGPTKPAQITSDGRIDLLMTVRLA